MKTSLFKQEKATPKKALSSFQLKMQAEQHSLDTIISGLMGNCHDPDPFPEFSNPIDILCMPITMQ